MSPEAQAAALPTMSHEDHAAVAAVLAARQ